MWLCFTTNLITVHVPQCSPHHYCPQKIEWVRICLPGREPGESILLWSCMWMTSAIKAAGDSPEPRSPCCVSLQQRIEKGTQVSGDNSSPVFHWAGLLGFCYLAFLVSEAGHQDWTRGSCCHITSCSSTKRLQIWWWRRNRRELLDCIVCCCCALKAGSITVTQAGWWLCPPLPDWVVTIQLSLGCSGHSTYKYTHKSSKHCSAKIGLQTWRFPLKGSVSPSFLLILRHNLLCKRYSSHFSCQICYYLHFNILLSFFFLNLL